MLVIVNEFLNWLICVYKTTFSEADTVMNGGESSCSTADTQNWKEC